MGERLEYELIARKPEETKKVKVIGEYKASSTFG